MFKLIGSVVVCGFALYGLARYLKRPVMTVVFDPRACAGTGQAVGPEDAAVPPTASASRAPDASDGDPASATA